MLIPLIHFSSSNNKAYVVELITLVPKEQGIQADFDNALKLLDKENRSRGDRCQNLGSKFLLRR